MTDASLPRGSRAEEARILYLDMDGVLNGHEKLPNGYCGTRPDCVGRFNDLLSEEPDLRIVVSSAWRYLVLNEMMTLTGFENLLLTHGLQVHKRIVGVTMRDEEFMPPSPTRQDYVELGCEVRGNQILADLLERKPAAWVVLDDLFIPVPHLVQTDGQRGLMPKDVSAVRRLLNPLPGTVPTDMGRAWV